MTSSDPIRLLDSPDMAASLRADLAQAGNVAVTGLDKTAGLSALQAAIAAEGAAAATATAASGSMLGKLAVGGLIVAGLGVAAWAATRPDPTPPPAVEAPAVSAPTAVAEAEVPPPPQLEPAPVVAAPTDVDAHTHAAEPEVEAEPEAEAEVAAPSKVRPHPRKKKKVETPVPEEPAESAVLREARMVREARKLLGVNPSRALALTREAADEFPRGQLVEEREAIAIRALAKLGRRDAAQARADRFLKKHGSGPHAEAVRRAIAD